MRTWFDDVLFGRIRAAGSSADAPHSGIENPLILGHDMVCPTTIVETIVAVGAISDEIHPAWCSHHGFIGHRPMLGRSGAWSVLLHPPFATYRATCARISSMAIEILLIQGWSLGSVYALVGFGFVATYKTNKVLNFTLPFLGAAGALILSSLVSDGGFGIARFRGKKPTDLDRRSPGWVGAVPCHRACTGGRNRRSRRTPRHPTAFWSLPVHLDDGHTYRSAHS